MLLLSSSHLIFEEQGGHAWHLQALPSPLIAAMDLAKATEQYTLVFGCKLVLYESSMDGSMPEGNGTVNLNDVVVEIFFNFDLVVRVVGSASNESDTIGRSNKPFAKKKAFVQEFDQPIFLLKEPRNHSNKKRLPHRSSTRLSTLSHQRKTHHPNESWFRTGAQTGA